VSTALSNSTSEGLSGSSSGISAVKVTACGASARSVIVTRTLSDVAFGVKGGAPSSVIEYEADVTFTFS
jgi:hypothetical protein